jgi:hypothetical protein
MADDEVDVPRPCQQPERIVAGDDRLEPIVTALDRPYLSAQPESPTGCAQAKPEHVRVEATGVGLPDVEHGAVERLTFGQTYDAT